MPRPWKGIVVRTVGVGIILFLGALALTGCDPGHNVTIRNESDTEVTVWRGAVQLTTLQPGEKDSYGALSFTGTTTYRAIDPHGNVLFERTFTFEELGDYGDIVIPAASPTLSP